MVDFSRGREFRVSKSFYDYSFILFMIGLFIFRVYYAGKINLATDEAYYWTWSRALSLGYYDSGAILGWIIRFFTEFIGHKELGVRMGSILFACGTNMLLYVLASRFISPLLALVGVIIFNITPGGTLLGTLMMHDSVMAFFWMLSLYFIYKGCVGKRRYWYFAGISSGLGLWSKDVFVLIIPLTFFFLLLTKEYRFWLKRKEPYIAVILMFLVFSPLIYWNSQHDWVTYRHIFALGSRPQGIDRFKRMGDFFGSQLGIVSPFIWFGIFFSWIKLSIAWVKNRSFKLLFILMYSMPIFFFFLILSTRSKVEGNWAGFAYYLGIICFLCLFDPKFLEEQGRKLRKVYYLVFSSIFSLLLVIIILYPRILYKVVPKLPYVSGYGNELLANDRTNDVHGWRELGMKTRALRETFYKDQDVFIFAFRYQICSEISFYYPNIRTYCFPFARRMNQYDIWGGFYDLVGKDGILVFDDRTDPGAVGRLKKYFDSVTWKTDIAVYRNDVPRRVIRTYAIFECKNFKGFEKTQEFKVY